MNGINLEIKAVDYLNIIRAGLKQLKYYENRRKNESSESLEHLKQDIEGYHKILATDSQTNAENFLDHKLLARFEGRKFSNNLAVIEHLKGLGVWEGEG